MTAANGIQEARATATDCVRQLWRERPHRTGSTQLDLEMFLPVQLQALVKQLGLTLSYPPSIDCGEGRDAIAGVLDVEHRAIEISSQFREEVRRFSLAHEIGHYLLHRDQDVLFRDRTYEARNASRTERLRERQADAFATEILIPGKYLRELFHQLFPNWSNEELRDMRDLRPKERAIRLATTEFWSNRAIDRPLTHRFGVTKDVMYKRLLELGLVRREVFLSYSQRDEPLVARLESSIEAAGLPSFRYESRLEGSRNINESLHDAIRHCQKLVVCCSRDALESEWVRRELHMAFEQEERRWGHPIVIPIDLDGHVHDIDDSWASQLRQRPIIDFRDCAQDPLKFHAAVGRLIAAVDHSRA